MPAVDREDIDGDQQPASIDARQQPRRRRVAAAGLDEQAQRGAVFQPGHQREQRGHQPQRERQAEQVAGSDEEVGRVVDGDDLPASDELYVPRPATIRISVAMIGWMPTLATGAIEQAAHRRGCQCGEQRQRHRDTRRMHLLAVDDDQRDQRGRHRGRDGDHRAHRDVDAARGDHHRHAQRHRHQRRGAVEDVDQRAVQVARRAG